jgi:hypothetical protein
MAQMFVAKEDAREGSLLASSAYQKAFEAMKNRLEPEVKSVFEPLSAVRPTASTGTVISQSIAKARLSAHPNAGNPTAADSRIEGRVRIRPAASELITCEAALEASECR